MYQSSLAPRQTAPTGIDEDLSSGRAVHAPGGPPHSSGWRPDLLPATVFLAYNAIGPAAREPLHTDNGAELEKTVLYGLGMMPRGDDLVAWILHDEVRQIYNQDGMDLKGREHVQDSTRAINSGISKAEPSRRE